MENEKSWQGDRRLDKCAICGEPSVGSFVGENETEGVFALCHKHAEEYSAHMSDAERKWFESKKAEKRNDILKTVAAIIYDELTDDVPCDIDDFVDYMRARCGDFCNGHCYLDFAGTKNERERSIECWYQWLKAKVKDMEDKNEKTFKTDKKQD